MAAFVLAGGFLVIALLVKYPNKGLLLSLCIAHYLVVRFLLWPRILNLQLTQQEHIERQTVDVRVLFVVTVIVAILGMAFAIWLALR
jgi:hypothetical protein